MILNLSLLKLMLSDINHIIHFQIFLGNHKWYPSSSDVFHRLPSVLCIVLQDIDFLPTLMKIDRH